MMCLNPIMVKDCQVRVPCGRCIGCKIAYTREWKIRLLNELQQHETAVFITLTYNDENLSRVAGSLQKRELQLFVKRLRKQFNNKKLKYYFIGEYGSKTNRAHYHGIVFGLSLTDLKLYKINEYFSSQIIEELWDFGFNVTGTVTHESIGYVTGYIQKKLFGKAVYLDKQKPFALMSQGLGKKWLLDNIDKIQDGIKMDGKNVGLPRYYKKYLYENVKGFKENIIEKAKLRERMKQNELGDDLIKKPKKLKFFEKYPDAKANIQRSYRLNKKRHLIAKSNLKESKL